MQVQVTGPFYRPSGFSEIRFGITWRHLLPHFLNDLRSAKFKSSCPHHFRPSFLSVGRGLRGGGGLHYWNFHWALSVPSSVGDWSFSWSHRRRQWLIFFKVKTGSERWSWKMRFLSSFLLRAAEGRPGMSDVSLPVWNLRAVIWFHFAISSLVLLPSPVTLSVLSVSAFWSFLLNFARKFFNIFREEIGFFVWLLCSS